MATGQTYGPAGMRSAGIASLNQPKFTPRENYIARLNQGHPDQLYDNKINRIISEGHHKQDKWEELGGPNYSIITPGGTLGPMEAFPTFNDRGQITPSWMDAGITNRNLGGAKVMNASDPTADGGWIDRLSKWIFGDNDSENDYLGPPPDGTFEDTVPYDPDNPNHFMAPEENPTYNPDNPWHFRIPEGMDPGDIDIEELINMERYNI